MHRSPLTLAALAVAAVPGLAADRVFALPSTSADDVDTAGVMDAAGNRYLVTSPRQDAAGARLEAEVRVVRSLLAAPGLRELIERPAGLARLPEGGHALVTHALPGAPLVLADVERTPGTAAALGRVIARIHDLPLELAESSGLPMYRAVDVRRRLRSQLERATDQHPVPPALLQRWRHALGDDALWDFTTCFTHGDLAEDRLQAAHGTVTGVRGWGAARVGDPAEDLVWLASALPENSVDVVLEAYRSERRGDVDARLADRVQLAGELALVAWLLHGLSSGDAAVVADADAMLADLEDEIERAARDEAENAYEEIPGRP